MMAVEENQETPGTMEYQETMEHEDHLDNKVHRVILDLLGLPETKGLREYKGSLEPVEMADLQGQRVPEVTMVTMAMTVRLVHQVAKV